MPLPGDKENRYKNNDWISKICRSLTTRLTLTRAIFLGSPYAWRHSDVCSPQSPCDPLISPPLHIKAKILYFLKMNVRTRSPIYLADTVSINKSFLHPNSDVLSFDLSKHQAHRVWIGNRSRDNEENIQFIFSHNSSPDANLLYELKSSFFKYFRSEVPLCPS